MRRGHLVHGDWRCLLRDPWASHCFPVFVIEILHFPLCSIISVSELSPSMIVVTCHDDHKSWGAIDSTDEHIDVPDEVTYDDE